jgi:hypothetical protein
MVDLWLPAGSSIDESVETLPVEIFLDDVSEDANNSHNDNDDEGSL